MISFPLFSSAFLQFAIEYPVFFLSVASDDWLENWLLLVEKGTLNVEWNKRRKIMLANMDYDSIYCGIKKLQVLVK